MWKDFVVNVFYELRILFMVVIGYLEMFDLESLLFFVMWYKV